MKKTKVITIDEDLDLFYRSQSNQINLSGFINELLRMHSRIDEKEFGEEKELKEKLDDLNNKISEMEKERSEVSAKIAMIEQKKKQQRKEEEEKHKQEMEQVDYINKTVKNSGHWHDML